MRVLVWRDGRRKRDGQIWVAYFERFRFVLRYDIIVLLSNRDPATGGGENYKRNNNYLYRYRRGRCDLPSHLQMAR